MAKIFDVTFVVVSYNSSQTLRASLESCVTAVNQFYSGTGKVVAYDNASTDSCPQIIDEFAAKHPDIFTGIKGNQNIGFGRANNRAIELFPSNTYILINPDVSFQPKTIPDLVHTLRKDEEIAVVCPKLLFNSGKVQPSIRRFPTFAYMLLRNLLGARLQHTLYPFDYYYNTLNYGDSQVDVDWGIGAFMVISGKYVNRHGLFDERFFLYFEDVSLCADVWKNGYRVVFQPSVSASHMYKQESTKAKLNYLKLVHTASALKYFAKYSNYKQPWHLLLRLLSVASKIRQAFFVPSTRFKF